jgi:hypothetical protein
MYDFVFNASALGAGGILERGNVITTIPSLASVALPPTGGEGRSVVSSFYSEELAFAHAETRVFGRQIGKRFTTSTYVHVRDVNIFDRVQVSRMTATLTSERGLDEDDDPEFEVDFSFDGIRVDGKGVKAVEDKAVKSLRRYRDLEKVLTEDARTLEAARLAPSKNAKGLLARFHARDLAALQGELKQRRAVQGSVLEDLENAPGQKQHHRLVVPGLGVVIFGEFMLKPGRRRLNMIRIELGDAAVGAFALDGGESLTGSMTIASVEGNGTPIGP